MPALDAWAVLDWLEGNEPVATRVDAALATRPVMSWINLGEVAYILERREGRVASLDIIRALRRRLALDRPTPERVLEAAAIKAHFAVSYADAFAVATAVATGSRLLTGDPEILAGDPAWPVEDIR